MVFIRVRILSLQIQQVKKKSITIEKTAGDFSDSI